MRIHKFMISLIVAIISIIELIKMNVQFVIMWICKPRPYRQSITFLFSNVLSSCDIKY